MDLRGENGDRTTAKDRLIEAGIDVFGEHSYEAATTRMIAKRAGVNIAAISYYFDGKKGLYHAMVEHIVDNLRAFVGPPLETIEKRTARGDLASAEALSLVETLLGRLVDFMVGVPEATRFARIVVREHLYPSSAHQIIENRVMYPMISGLASLIAAATGQPVSDDKRLQALAFMGQVMVFRVARQTLIKELGFVGYSAEETQTIRRVILEQTRGAIESRIRV